MKVYVAATDVARVVTVTVFPLQDATETAVPSQRFVTRESVVPGRQATLHTFESIM
jgi:hypothetical protein